MTAWRTSLVVLCSALAPGELAAQATFTVTPSINVAMVSDSNLFMRPADRQSDLISRVSPAVDAGYRSTRLTLLGRYTVDAERFAEHASLTTPRARQQAAVDVLYRPGRRLTFGADASLSTTETAGELNTVSGLTLARVSARRVAVSPTLTYKYDAVTEGTVKYAFVGDRLAGGAPLAAHTATMTGERHVSRRDAARVDYIFRAFDFGSEGSTRSHVVTVGWTRSLSRRASLTAGGGPRMGDGELTPELSASVSYRLEAADLSIEYARTETTLIGLPGAADTDSVSARAAFGRLDALRIRLVPGVMHTARAGLEARVYRLGIGVSLPIGRRLTLDAAYDATHQRGDVYTARADDVVTRHVILIECGRNAGDAGTSMKTLRVGALLDCARAAAPGPGIRDWSRGRAGHRGVEQHGGQPDRAGAPGRQDLAAAPERCHRVRPDAVAVAGSAHQGADQLSSRRRRSPSSCERSTATR